MVEVGREGSGEENGLERIAGVLPSAKGEDSGVPDLWGVIAAAAARAYSIVKGETEKQIDYRDLGLCKV